MRIEITPEAIVNLYREGEDVPFLYQPHYPDGTPFESVEAAQVWAEAYVADRLAEIEAENV